MNDREKALEGWITENLNLEPREGRDACPIAASPHEYWSAYDRVVEKQRMDSESSEPDVSTVWD